MGRNQHREDLEELPGLPEGLGAIPHRSVLNDRLPVTLSAGRQSQQGNEA